MYFSATGQVAGDGLVLVDLRTGVAAGLVELR